MQSNDGEIKTVRVRVAKIDLINGFIRAVNELKENDGFWLAFVPDDIKAAFYDQTKKIVENDMPDGYGTDPAVIEEIAKGATDYFDRNFDLAFRAAVVVLMVESFRFANASRHSPGLPSGHMPTASELAEITANVRKAYIKGAGLNLRGVGPHKGKKTNEQDFWQDFKEAIRRLEAKGNKASKKNVAEALKFSEQWLFELCKRYAFDESGQHFRRALRLAKQQP